MTEHRKAAVVGAGVAGLTAAYVLASSYEVTLYEADDRLGGHAHTRELPGPGGQALAVDRVVERMAYEHPVYTPASVAAQKELPRLNTGVTAYAGARHGWGFHEDGCRSGVEAARSLGVSG
nr:FAD-dependent oxidoreductase [Streptomyces sp. NRRL B-24572]